ncbi:MAG: hypothetical protein ACRCVV_22055 [Shewanella sp.]
MSIFSRTKYYFGSASTLIMDETPDLAGDSIRISVLNNRDIANDLVANYLDSLHMKGKQLRRYAKTHYTRGLPEGSTNYQQPKNDLVRIVLRSLLGHNVFILKNVIDNPDPIRFSFPFMTDNRGYDISKNTLSKPPYSAPNGAVVRIEWAEFITNSTIEIVYGHTTSSGNDYTDTFREVITLDAPVNMEERYYHVAYYPLDKYAEISGPMAFWYYNEASNKYPVLTLPPQVIEESQYYPIIPIREEKVNMTDESHRDTELYKTSKRTLKFFGIDINSLSEAVHESPDIKDVYHAYFTVGVSIKDDNEYVLEYLYNYFLYLYDVSKVSKLEFDYWLYNYSQDEDSDEMPPINEVHIKDSKYSSTVYYNYVTVNIDEGVIGDGKVGTLERVVNTGGGIRLDDNTFYELSEYSIKCQITPSFIQTVTVSGLMHQSYVVAGGRGKYINTSLHTAIHNDEDDVNNFIIPINIDVCESMSNIKANGVLYYSIRLVFHSMVKKKLKWYQTGIFKGLVMVLAFVLTAYGVGQFVGTLAAATSVAEVAMLIAQTIAVGAAVNIAMDFLVNVVGLELAMVVALIASAVTLTKSDISFKDLGAFKLPNAVDLLQITNAMHGSLQGIMKDELLEIYSDMDEFIKYGEALLEELEDIKDMGEINPYTLGVISTSMGAYETAEEFINRTTYDDNIGVLALETPSTFVERMLELDIPTNEIRTQVM